MRLRFSQQQGTHLFGNGTADPVFHVIAHIYRLTARQQGILTLAVDLKAYGKASVAHPNAGDTRLDLKALIGEKFAGLRPIVCANLPYNITTPVLTALVDIPAIESITVLIQKEAAQRLTSAKGSADGAFPLRLQYEMETECLFDVPPEKFLPAPKVTSTVLRCVRRKEPPVAVRDEAFFFRVIKGAFLLRRKTLSNSLSAALPGWDKAAIADAIAVCGLPASVRGEALTLTEFAALADALAERK